MKTLSLILGDQLSQSVSSLKGYNPDTDIILMCEVWNEATYVKHHKKKIAFLFSAMRHFAEGLKNKGFNVEYTTLDHPENTGSFSGEVKRMLSKHSFDRLVVTHPGEYRVLEELQGLENELNIVIEIRDDDRFLCTPDEFANWTTNRKQLRMEYFYREMRKKYDILMDGKDPIGGQWNYDAENRKPPKEGLTIPPPYIGKIDNITDEHFRFLMTAIRYNQVHAVVIAAIGLALLNGGKLSNVPALKWSGLLFIIGTVLFSFSIYLSVSLDIPSLVNITPVGGMTIMAAWLVLIVAGVLSRKKL